MLKFQVYLTESSQLPWEVGVIRIILTDEETDAQRRLGDLSEMTQLISSMDGFLPSFSGA